MKSMRFYQVLLIINFVFVLFPPLITERPPFVEVSILKNTLFRPITNGKIKDHYVYPARNIIDTIDKKYDSQAGFFISDQLFSFSYNQNPESTEEIKYIGDCMLSCIEGCRCDYLTPSLKEHIDNWTEELKHFPFEFPSKMPEAFHFRHGLRFQPKAIQDYVKQRDMLDLGAYIGDSAIALSNYTDKRIYSYEISQTFVNDAHIQLKRFNLQDKVHIFVKGMSNTTGVMRISDNVDLGQNLEFSQRKEGGYEIQVTTIDNEVNIYNLSVGFIKADVEGLGLKVLHGGIQTIKRDRPIIELASYHVFDEMFGFPEFISHFPNYLFEFHNEGPSFYSLHECSIFAYPAEILYPVYKDFEM